MITDLPDIYTVYDNPRDYPGKDDPAILET
jgi:hypothetical protein